jgi:ferredoxin--NADP+ reductase
MNSVAVLLLLLAPAISVCHAISLSRIKAVGGGLPVVPPGNFNLFDPDLDGKLQGTGILQERLQQANNYLPPSAASADIPTDLLDCQAFLEHLDENIPLNTVKPSAPVDATMLARSRLISEDAPGDIQHVILKLPEGFHYVEGQSLSVIPDLNDGVKQKPRLYSIASTRYGDALDGTTVSLCVRRAEYYDPVTGLADPAKKGVCSNWLCDMSAGTTVKVAGPVGKTMLLPKDPTTDIILVATGTGIAPFRSFLHRLFMENTVARHMFQGNAWLILGVPTTGGLLYPQEFQAMQQQAQPGQLLIDYAISREMTNRDGGKMYVQHVLQEKAAELWEKLDNGAQIYFCGLKGMLPGILETLEKVAQERGVDWDSKLKELKANGQWHVEVY